MTNWLTLEDASKVLGKKAVTLRWWCRESRICARQVKGYNDRMVWEVDISTAPKPKASAKRVCAKYEAIHTAWVKAQLTGTGYERPYAKSSVDANILGLSNMWKWLGQSPTIETLSVKTLALALGNAPLDKHVQKEHAYKAYRHFVNYLIEWHNASDDLLKKIDRLRPKRHGDPRRLKLNGFEAHRLLKASKTLSMELYHRERLDMAVRIILESGLRASELLALRWEDVNLEKRTIKVRLGKGGKSRTTTFSESLLEPLSKWKETHWQYGETILNDWTYNAFRKSFNHLRVHSGLNIDIHGLRRTCATLWLERGVDIHIIQRLLGHSSIKTTMIYVEFDDCRTLAYMDAHYQRAS